MPPTETSVPLPVEMPDYGIYLLESHHRQDFRMEYTRHSFLKVIYALRGSGRLHLRHSKRSYTIFRDNIVLIPAEVSHRLVDRAGDPMSLYALCVQRRVVSGFGDYDFTKEPVVLREIPLRADVTSALRRIFYEQTIRKPAGSLLIAGLAYQVLAMVARMRRADVESIHDFQNAGPSSAQARVAAYVRDVEHSFHQHDTIDRISSRLGISRRRFTDLFKEATGETWYEHVTRLRLNHAKALIASTGRTLLSISFECGYNDFSTFYRAFKKETGRSPEAWRSGTPS